MKKKQPKQAFTLIELLTVIAIIGILASILIPTVGRVREAARRTVDASNIRQIGQASLIYANDNREQLPPRGGKGKRGLTATGEPDAVGTTTPSLTAIAAALARSAGLNDASIWISTSDKHPDVTAQNQTTVLSGTTIKTVTKEFDNSGYSFAYIAGLSTSMSSSTPIAFTRGANIYGSPTGKWSSPSSNPAVYGTDGGHVVFLGGNVSFYKDLGTSGETGTGIFTTFDDGKRTNAMVDVVPNHDANGQQFYSDPASASGEPGGM